MPASTIADETQLRAAIFRYAPLPFLHLAITKNACILIVLNQMAGPGFVTVKAFLSQLMILGVLIVFNATSAKAVETIKNINPVSNQFFIVFIVVLLIYFWQNYNIFISIR